MHNIALPLSAPRADLLGIYTLTITAASDCLVGIGDQHVIQEARVHSYKATLQQRGPAVEVRLSGETLPEGRYGFDGRVEPGRVVFDLRWLDGDLPYVVEQLPTSSTLVWEGIVIATASATRLAGTLSGTFQTFETWNISAEPIAWCSSASHRFVLSRLSRSSLSDSALSRRSRGLCDSGLPTVY